MRQSRIRRWIVAIVGLTGAAMLGTAGAANAAAQVAQSRPAMTVVKVGVSGRPDQAMIDLAYRRGYFERQDIDFQPVTASSAQDFVSSLATNQIQAVSGAPNVALFNALNRNIDIRMVADYAHVGPASDSNISLMVRADLATSGAVKSPADLKGRVIGSGPLKGQYADLLVHKILDLGHLSPNDVTLQYLGFADGLAAMVSKRLDAAVLIEPMVTQAAAQNIGKILITGGAADPGAELAVLQYSAEFAHQTDLATRFMVAYLQGVRDYYDAFFLKKDRDAAIDILVKDLPIKDRKIWETSGTQYTDLNGNINVDNLRSQATFYASEGLLTGPTPDFDKYVDLSFAKAAVAILGSRQRE